MGNSAGQSRQNEYAASVIVAEREGKKYVKNMKALMKVCGMHPGGRLQPEEWRLVLRDKRGKLEDSGFLQCAEAWMRVAKFLHSKGAIEKFSEDGKCYVYEFPHGQLDEDKGTQPPPYNGRRSDWTCGVCSVQNPDERETCFNCGAPRPHKGVQKVQEPPMAPPPVAIRTSFQDTRPEAVPSLPKAEFPASPPPVTPLYPVLNMDGTYHVPPEAKPPVAMIAVEQEGEGDGLGETAMPENPYSPALPSNTQWSSGHRPPVVSRPSWAPRMPALDFSTPMGRELAMMSHRPDATFRTVDEATPSSAAATTLVTSLPDPEKQPMPFYRRMAQIQKTHSATWRDLKGLAEIKVSGFK